MLTTMVNPRGYDAHLFIPGLGRLRQENQEFEASLGYILSPCLKRREEQKRVGTKNEILFLVS